MLETRITGQAAATLVGKIPSTSLQAILPIIIAWLFGSAGRFSSQMLTISRAIGRSRFATWWGAQVSAYQGRLVRVREGLSLLSTYGTRWQVSTSCPTDPYVGKEVRVIGASGPGDVLYADRIELARAKRAPRP
jgi:hypothetical protein